MTALQLSDVYKTAYILGSQLWHEIFEDRLRLVKECTVDAWEVKKQKLYSEIITVTRWLEMQSLSLGLERQGIVNWVSGRIGINWVSFYVAIILYSVVMC